AASRPAVPRDCAAAAVRPMRRGWSRGRQATRRDRAKSVGVRRAFRASDPRPEADCRAAAQRLAQSSCLPSLSSRRQRMGTRDPRVDAYIAKAADFAKPILTELRETVHAACPDVEETMKWSFPHFMHQGMLCSMAAFKQHAVFGFWKGSLIVKDDGTKAESGMG